ncbi:hypothetical protein 8014-B2_0058 [Lactobacillus phage ATCC 8014-B2]|uniref:Uncharacterized protein n=1 Tax=Lactobacillus phage ATCC 8014-B2 TaxID=1225795 RepID=K4I4D8_9CAUD|nr:hypothetical protein HOQ89_gp088 [Lactobacillus phage ATCC 8014-B2]AFU63125.1 hypothetical protein 8014-B2_0058 [Lactobacillus phage ATCC 8014-B2]
MINRNEIVDYIRSDHFKKRARQRFGISKTTMKSWIANIAAHGSLCHTEQENIAFLDNEEIRIVLDTYNKSLVTTYSLHDIVWISKRSNNEMANKSIINDVVDSLTSSFDGMLRKQNKKINNIIKALNELQEVHNSTKRQDYYLDQEKKIEEVEKKLFVELANKQELIKISNNILCKE